MAMMSSLRKRSLPFSSQQQYQTIRASEMVCLVSSPLDFELIALGGGYGANPDGPPPLGDLQFLARKNGNTGEDFLSAECHVNRSRG